MKKGLHLSVLAVLILLATIQTVIARQTTFTDSVRIQIFKVDIPQLTRERTVRVYLPKAYFNHKKNYPVIYMQDGQNLFSNQNSNKNSWMIDSLLAQLPDRKQCIIVGIDNGKSRMSEYSPYNSNYSKAEGGAYTSFIVKNLKPFIDQKYRTKTKAKFTAIAGSSMGGLISMYAALKYPKVFGTAGIFSPAFWLSAEIYKEAEQVSQKKSKFFLACGDAEGNETDYVNKMAAVLRKKGADEMHVPTPLILKNAKHNEQQWRIAFQQFYTWFSSSF